jgi:hypothetical protein
LAYMVKGTDFVTARKHGATARRQGTVNFKRAGWSQSLGSGERTIQKVGPGLKQATTHRIS